MNPLLDEFIAESREQTAAGAAALAVLERQPADADALNAAFRAVHTVKGSCRLFALEPMARLLSAMEDLLDAAREHELDVDAHHVDLLLQAFDRVEAWVDELEAAGGLAAGAASRASALEADLRSASGRADATAATPNRVATRANWLADVAPALRARLHAVCGDSPLVAILFEPEAESFFAGDDPLYTLRKLPGLVGLDAAAREPWGPLDRFDVYRCRLRLFAFCTGDVAAVDAALAGTKGTLAIAAVDPAELAAAPGAAASVDVTPARALLEAQALMLSRPAPAALLPVRLRSAAAVAARCAQALNRPQAAVALLAAGRDGDLATLSATLAELLADPVPATPAAPELAPDPATLPPPPAAPEGPAGEQVRVELRQLDRLVDLVAELVVAENALPYLAAQAEAQGLRPFARALKERHAAIHRIVDDLQDTTAKARMVPLAQSFRRLPRLTRDAAQRVDKEVDLELEGGSVAADRRVVEALGEPLTHLVRNAVDHGLEAPAQRVAAGKPAHGRLRVAARIEGERLLLDVSDDGRGVDLEAVRHRAYERRLIDEDALATLSDHAAFQLLFRPGFSTRGKVTEMSGRGVGLDVVRNAVQALGGSVDLQSRRGVGTRVTLRVPLSLATAEVVLLHADGQRFGVPAAQVAQTLRLRGDDVRRVGHRRAFVLRGQLVPLVAASELLGLRASAAPRSLAVVVARVNSGLVGLAVDGFGDLTHVVLKPLEGGLGGLHQYSGSAVLADGTVLLVLDLPNLLAGASQALPA